MAEGQWYYTQGGKQTGPVSFYQLQQLASVGTLQPTDHVWTEGQGDWKPAREIPELFHSGSATFSGTADFVLPSDPPRDPTLMAILSLVIPGLGQIVLGQNIKGLAFLAACLGLSVVTCYGGGVFTMLLLVAADVVAIIDAYQIGQKLQQGRPVAQWEFF